MCIDETRDYDHSLRVDNTVSIGIWALCRAADPFDLVATDQYESVGINVPRVIDGDDIPVLDQYSGHSVGQLFATNLCRLG
jgi:hypothetical protein